jgi:hypothetical protein
MGVAWVAAMTRRNFIQRFVLVLLTLLFGPKVVAALTQEQLEPMLDWADDRLEFRMRYYAQLMCTRPCDNVLITW